MERNDRTFGRACSALAATVVGLTALAWAYGHWQEAQGGAAVATAGSAPPSASEALTQSAPPLRVGPLRVHAWGLVGPVDTGAPVSSLLTDPDTGELIAASPQGWLFSSGRDGYAWQAVLPLQPGKDEAQGAPFRQVELVTGTNGARALFAVAAGGSLLRSEGATGTYKYTGTYDVHRIRRVGSRFFAVGTFGVRFTSDAGATWQAYSDLDPYQKPACFDAGVSSKHTLVLCDNASIYRSGAQYYYRSVSLGEPRYTKRGGRLAVSRSDPRIVYASFATSDYLGGSGAFVYRSTDGGDTWTLRASPADANPFHRYLLGDFDSECGKAPVLGDPRHVLEVDPADPDVVWLGGTDLYRSEDGGLNFRRAAVRAAAAGQPYRLPGRINTLHFRSGGADDGALLAATTEGLFRASDRTAAVQSAVPGSCAVGDAPAIAWEPRHAGYSAHAITAMAMDPGGQLLAAMHDGEAGQLLYGDADRPAEPWLMLARSAPTTIALDPQRGLDEFYTDRCMGNRLCRWSLESATGRWTAAAASGYEPAADGTHSILVPDPHNRARFWSNTGLQPLRSDNAMATFAHAGWGMNSVVSSGAVSPADPNIVLFGSYDYHGGSKIYWRHNALVENPGWNSASLGGYGGNVTQVVFDPSTPGRVYATIAASPGSPVRVSDDNGQNWRAIPLQYADPIYQRRAYSIAVDPDRPSILYVGTDDGVFVHTVSGTQTVWTRLNAPFPLTMVRQLTMRRLADGRRLLYAVTEGRGVWAVQVELPYFTDVSFDHWAHDFIDRLARAGITTGCATTPMRYCPDQRVTRDQMAVFLLRSKHGSGYRAPAPTGVFDDVPVSHWAAGWIERLRAEGVSTGCSAAPLLYCPDRDVTREQMAVFLLRAKYGANYRPPAATGTFEDVPVEHWAAAWIEQLEREGITGGCSATRRLYCPAGTVTRDQMAVFLVRAFAL